MGNAKGGFFLKMAGGLLIAAMLAGCNLVRTIGSSDGSQPAENYLPADICMEPSVLKFDMVAAGQAPTMPEIDPNTPPELGILGAEGAAELALALAPEGTFCSLAVSDSAGLVIAHAMKLVEQGKPQDAREVLSEWLAVQSSQLDEVASSAHAQKSVAKLAAPVQSGDTARQGIRDLLNAAAADQAAGGDGSTYSNAANQAFRDLFADEIVDAGFGDSMRLTEEAGRLGETELQNTASNRARKIWEEKLQADLEDFDPCTASRDDVRDLLNSLGQAMLLGVQGSFEDNGKYREAVTAKTQAAVQQMYNQAATKVGLSELTSPVPQCTLGGHIEVREMLAFAKEPCIHAIPFTLTWHGNSARLEGSGETECSHVEENLGGSQGNLHQKSNYTMSFDGEATSGSPGSLQVTLTANGEYLEYLSGFPKELVPAFTEKNPFKVSGESTFTLTFEFREGAKTEILNKDGQPALTFILHLITTP